MPGDILHAVECADTDDEVHVIIIEYECQTSCEGYDLNEYAQGADTDNITADHPCRQKKRIETRWWTTRL